MPLNNTEGVIDQNKSKALYVQYSIKKPSKYISSKHILSCNSQK